MPRIRQTSFLGIDAAPATDRERELTIVDWQLGAVQPPGLSRVLFDDLDQPSGEGERRRVEHRFEQESALRLEQELATARKKGFAQGYTEGLEEGKTEGASRGLAAAQGELEAHRTTVRETVESLSRAREELLTTLELDLSEIVLTLASELAAGAVEAEPERVVELARQGMSLLAESDTINLRAAPAPAALLREAVDKLKAGTAVTEISVSEDPGLEAAGCIVESELARIDLRVSQRLVAARDLLSRTRGEG